MEVSSYEVVYLVGYSDCDRRRCVQTALFERSLLIYLLSISLSSLSLEVSSFNPLLRRPQPNPSSAMFAELINGKKYEEFEALLRSMPDAALNSVDFGGSERSTSLMSMLARTGRPDLVALALSKGGDPNQLHRAADSNKACPSVTPLWAAMAMNDEATVRVLLSHGATCDPSNSRSCGYNENIFLDTDVEAKFSPEEVPAMKAYLLSKCDLERDPDGGLSIGDDWSPLYWAVRHGNVSLIRDMTTTAKGNVFQRSRLGFTLFDEACRHNQLMAMATLCDLGFQPLQPPPKKSMWWDVNGASGTSASFPPCTDVEVYSALLDDYGFPLPTSLIIPSITVNLQDLFDCRNLSQIEADAVAFVKEQLRRGVTVRSASIETGDGGGDGDGNDDVDDDNVLFFCPNASICQLLLDAGASVSSRNRFGGSVLLMAVRNGYHDMVPLLLAAGANVKDALWYHEGESSDYLYMSSQALHAAVHPSQQASDAKVTSMVRDLLAAGANPLVVDCEGRSSLWMALFGQHREAAVEMLKHVPATMTYAQLNAGIPVDEECFGGHDTEDGFDAEPQLSLLHVAAGSGCWQAVEYMLSLSDCDVNERSVQCELDTGGHTALHYVCQHRTMDEYLVSDDPNTAEEVRDYHKTVCQLLAAGADATVQGYKKETPLHWLTIDSADEALSVVHAIVSQVGGFVLGLENDLKQTPLAKIRAMKYGRRIANRESAAAMLESAALKYNVAANATG
jgi:ankyrin repeat protein